MLRVSKCRSGLVLSKPHSLKTQHPFPMVKHALNIWQDVAVDIFNLRIKKSIFFKKEI